MSWKMEEDILISSPSSPLVSPLATLRTKGEEFWFPLAVKYVPNKTENHGSFVAGNNVVDNGLTGP